MKRVFLIVLDSFGIGAMPDSESFGDVGVNTLAACATSQYLHIPKEFRVRRSADTAGIQHKQKNSFHSDTSRQE